MDILIQYNLIDEPEENEFYSGYISEFNEVDGGQMWENMKTCCER